MSDEPRFFDTLIHRLRGFNVFGSHLRGSWLPIRTICTFEASLMMFIVLRLLCRRLTKVNRLNLVQTVASEVRRVLLQVRAASLLLEAQELGLKRRILLSELLDFRFKLLAIGLKEGLILGLMV